MAFITVGDVQMFYEDLGKPDGLPIIMLHGFTGTGRADWIHQIDSFGSSYRLILPDLRGHGRSSNPGGPCGDESPTARFRRRLAL